MIRTVLLVLLAAAPLGAQDPPRAEALRRQVIERVIQNIRAQAALDDAQFDRFRRQMEESMRARRQLQQQEREVWRSLQTQMRPGVAADPDSVSDLLGRLLDIQSELVQHRRADQEQLAEYLDPIQQAQVVIALRRLQNSIDDIVRRRVERRR